MDRLHRPSVSLFRNDGAQIRACLVANDTRKLVTRDEVLRIEVKLVRLSPEKRALQQWFADLEADVTDGPVFNKQDPAWPSNEVGYNFFWELPSGFTSRAPAKYRIVVKALLRGSRQATTTVDLKVRDPDSHA